MCIDVIIYRNWERNVLIIHFKYLVHPCDEANNGDCSQICNKKEEKHECSCEAGFLLAEDKRNCKKGWLRYVPCEYLYILGKIGKFISEMSYLLTLFYNFSASLW